MTVYHGQTFLAIWLPSVKVSSTSKCIDHQKVEEKNKLKVKIIFD